MMEKDKVFIDIEKIIETYGNKYKAIIIAALEARQLKDLQKKHLFDPDANNILEAIKRLLDKKILIEDEAK